MGSGALHGLGGGGDVDPSDVILAAAAEPPRAGGVEHEQEEGGGESGERLAHLNSRPAADGAGAGAGARNDLMKNNTNAGAGVSARVPGGGGSGGGGGGRASSRWAKLRQSSQREINLYTLPSCAENEPRVEAARTTVKQVLSDVHAADVAGSFTNASVATDRVLLSASEGFDLPVDNILASLDAFVERMDDFQTKSGHRRGGGGSGGGGGGKHGDNVGTFAVRPIRVHLVNRVELQVTPWLSWTEASTATRVSATPSGTILGLAEDDDDDDDGGDDGERGESGGGGGGGREKKSDVELSAVQRRTTKMLFSAKRKKFLTVVGCSCEEVEMALVAAAFSEGGARGALAVIIPPLALGFRDNMVGECLDIGVLPSVQAEEVSVAAAVDSSEGLSNALTDNLKRRMGWARFIGYMIAAHGEKRVFDFLSHPLATRSTGAGGAGGAGGGRDGGGGERGGGGVGGRMLTSGLNVAAGSYLKGAPVSFEAVVDSFMDTCRDADRVLEFAQVLGAVVIQAEKKDVKKEEKHDGGKGGGGDGDDGDGVLAFGKKAKQDEAKGEEIITVTFYGCIKWVMLFMYKDQFSAACVVFLSIFYSGCYSLGQPLLFLRVIDAANEGAATGGQSGGGKLLMFMLLVLLGQCMDAFLQYKRNAVEPTGDGFNINHRLKLALHVASLPQLFHDNAHRSKILAIMQNDVPIISDSVSTTFNSVWLIFRMFSMVVLVCYLATNAPVLVTPLAVLLPIFWRIQQLEGRSMSKKNTEFRIEEKAGGRPLTLCPTICE